MSVSNIQDTYPLSPMQQGMLFQYQLDPRSGLYIQQVPCSLHEELKVPAFQKAWEQVLARHPVLRTSFRWEGIDEPLQDVHAHVSLPFEKQDWRDMSSGGKESKLEEYLKLDRRRGFDLTRAPLVRLALFRTGDGDYQLVFTYHHIIADGWARSILISEVFAFYDAYREGRDLQLERPRPYRDHIDWLHQKDPSASEAFWRQLLSGFTASTPVDAIADTKGLDDGRGDYTEQEIRIAEPTTSCIKTVAEQHHLTLNTLIQGAWALLLSRYTGQDDVVFGAVRACRRSTVEGAGSIVGLFLNTLPLRVRISSGQNLIRWLGELREQHIAVRDHEQTPLVELMGWSDVPRGTPLFESMIVFDYARLNTRLRGRGGSWLNREFRVIEDPAFALVLHAYGEPELLVRIVYDRRLFDDATIERMLGHLRTLLEGMAENLDRPLAALPILTAAERHQLLVEWNDTRVEYPQQLCIHQLFEAQAERTPDAVAVAFEGERLTYRELNRQANQLAHYLQSVGVGPDVLVGIAVERSLEMVVALYGILKAGGAYVPLDPTYPTERIAYMVEDADVPVLLTQAELLGQLSPHGAQVICLDTDWNDLVAGQSIENPVCAANLENLAYTIYTSGSTGKPKGAMNTHRGILNRLLWMQETYQLESFDRVLQKTPFSFDVSAWEFFWPLMFGARLVVARPEGHKDNDYLVQTIIDRQVTTVHFVPSMLQLFLETEDVEKCDSLRRVICSGEALPLDLQNRFFARLDAELHNLYGPTEAAVDVTYWECQRESDLRTVPIGRPVANTQLYVLDSYMQPVPIGVAGELYIGGIQVARGYLNRPELTAEKFIPDPFSDDPKARLYKTGDLVRYLPNGSIEFLGRLDFQVKVRGFRIELGEIEAVLSQHPMVREVVVLAREDVPGDKRLVAYVVPNLYSPLRIGELREYLKEKLPDYMVPAAFVPLEALPLTPNGKMDRRNLPAPEWERQSQKAYVPPQKELEKTIAGIWQELLQVERVGLDDSFFELGGHSLLIVQAHSRLSKVSDRELSLTDMFRFPTIRALTQYLSRDSGKGEQVTMRKSTDRAKTRREAMMRGRWRRQRARTGTADERL